MTSLPHKENLVSIKKVDTTIGAAVKEALNLTGGMESVVNPGETIYLKPNFVAPRDSSTGVTTNLEVIRVVAEEVRRCGGIPILFETPAIEFDKEQVYQYLGVRDFARQNQITLMDSPLDLIKVPVPAGVVYRSLSIPKILHQAKIINIPKLKTHVSAKMTCGMKNLIGLLPDSEKRRVHIWGVHAPIADICRVLRPVLTVVDAMACMEGDGPTYGDTLDLDLIVCGKDTLATDKVCSQIIGLRWQDVEYIRLVDADVDGEEISLVGESIQDVCRQFEIPQKGILYDVSTRFIHIFDLGFSRICSMHFSQFLFNTGRFGTNPKIIRQVCDGCGDCVKVCPVEKALDIATCKVDYKKCIRCLNCYLACHKKAIAVKGFSRPEDR